MIKTNLSGQEKQEQMHSIQSFLKLRQRENETESDRHFAFDCNQTGVALLAPQAIYDKKK